MHVPVVEESVFEGLAALSRRLSGEVIAAERECARERERDKEERRRKGRKERERKRKRRAAFSKEGRAGGG